VGVGFLMLLVWWGLAVGVGHFGHFGCVDGRSEW
jgi:hypothetical protein